MGRHRIKWACGPGAWSILWGGLALLWVLFVSTQVHGSDRVAEMEETAMSQDETELSESGDPIYRHKSRQRERAVPQHAGEHLEEIEAHVEKYIGEVETVFHEVVSDLVHLDILFVPATEARPYHLLVTCGVSDEPMRVPEGMERYRRAELLVALPREWALTEDSFKNESNYWPVRWLKLVGRLPHEYETWIGPGHTIPNGDPPGAIANTGFVGVMLSPPYWLSAEFFQLAAKSGETISFYVMVPLYREEMELKLERGAEEIEGRLEKGGVGFVLDTQRPNVGLKRGWFRR